MGASIGRMHARTDRRHARTPATAVALIAIAISMGATWSTFGVAASDAPAGALKVSVASGPTLPLGHAADRWTRLLLDSGDARLAAKLHPGVSLAGRDAAREFAALKDGSADLAVGSALQWALQVPALGVYALPWIAPDDRSLQALVASRPLVDALASRLDAHGVVLVAIGALGHRAIATSTRAIRAPADVKGLRVRASAAPMLHEMFLALGALPQAMPFAAAQAAIAGGALDGQEGTPAALAAARIGAGGQRHLTAWGAIGDAMVFAVRRPLWETLSDAQRELILRAARQAIAETDALTREEAAMRKLAQNGMGIVRITAAGHDAFRAEVREVNARWREAIGADVVDLAEKALAQVPPAKGS